MSPPPEDDADRTVVRVPSRHGAAAPAPPAAEAEGHVLAAGTRLGEFEIRSRLGEGGFSIVYIAWDHSLDREVALKEYMPGQIASRHGGTRVDPRSERHQETFEAGLRSFVNEAKLLAQFDHPALVKVHRFWEANGTAYMVMPLYRGQTVRDTVRAMAQPPSQDWIVRVLRPLSEALGVIHAAHCFHRDIAPDNVLLLGEGQPLLLDFGAARRVVGGMTQALTVILKPGYAPIEQYDEIPGMKQGPWTDVYALAAMVHWMATGQTPPPSVGRSLRDQYQPLAERAAGRYDARFLHAVDRALVVLPERRTPTVEAFMADLGGGGAEVAARDADATVIRPRTPRAARPAHAAPTRRAAIGGALVGVVALAGGAAWWFENTKPDRETAQPVTVVPPPVAAPAPPPALELPAAPAVAMPVAPPPAAEPSPPPPVAVSPTPPVASPPEAQASAPPVTAKAPRVAPAPPRNEANASECASVLQRLSLGDSSPELVEKMKTLGCR
jgi:serine/threonine protein kinase